MGRVRLLLWVIPGLFACDCGTSTVAEAYRHADVIFVGINRTDPFEHSPDWSPRQYSFEVKEVLKGTIGKTVMIDVSDGNDCAVSFPLNWTSLIYAYKDRRTGMLGTSLCTRTKSMENGQKEVEELRKMREADKKSPTRTAEQSIGTRAGEPVKVEGA